MRLTSWIEKGPNWCSSDELIALHMRVQSMVDKNIKLVNVIQVMLIRLILPCQCWTSHLWEYEAAKHQILLKFFGTTHDNIWKVLFKANEAWLDTTEDRGHNLAHPTSLVSVYMFSRCFLYLLSRGRCLGLPIIISVLDKEGGADLLSGSASRRH